MIYGSVCSGIEAATVAWHPLGWRPAFFSEIEAFPRAVLAHHYPGTPCHGDFTTIEAGQYDAIELLVGGTPCQSFSLAGLRAGLDDDRGNLALEFCRLARRLRPRWVVWENVTGVFSVDAGNAFGSILGGLADCGYGLAYRVLDAQFVRVDGFGRAVPQRRRRVFVVGHLGGSWQRAGAVLFERQGLRRDAAPRRAAGETVARAITASLGKRGGVPDADNASDGGLVVAHTLNAKGGAGRNDSDSDSETFIAISIDGAPVAHTLRAKGFDASEDGTGRGTPVMAFGAKDHGADATFDVAPTLRAGAHSNSHQNGGVMPAIAYRTTGNDGAYDCGEIAPCLNTGTDPNQVTLLTGWRVRRLMPVECERLQGFPDGYTAVPYRGKAAADGPRYRALGNSMAVNVMRWIGRRIEAVDAIEMAAA